MGEEELAPFIGVDNGDGLDLIEDNTLLAERFLVIVIGAFFEEEHLRTVNHAPASVFEVFFVNALEFFVKNVNVFLSVLLADLVVNLGKHTVARRSCGIVIAEAVTDELVAHLLCRFLGCPVNHLRCGLFVRKVHAQTEPVKEFNARSVVIHSCDLDNVLHAVSVKTGEV